MEHYSALLLTGKKEQVKPHKGKEVVLRHVLNDLVSRAEHGKGIYGTYLETFNGRNAVQDAYEEALDLCMYLKQILLEMDERLLTDE